MPIMPDDRVMHVTSKRTGTVLSRRHDKVYGPLLHVEFDDDSSRREVKEMYLQRTEVDMTDKQLAEKRATKIADLEKHGDLDPKCAGCSDHYLYYSTEWRPGKFGLMAPSHKPSPRCESGKHPHCTCPVCWG